MWPSRCQHGDGGSWAGAEKSPKLALNGPEIADLINSGSEQLCSEPQGEDGFLTAGGLMTASIIMLLIVAVTLIQAIKH